MGLAMLEFAETVLKEIRQLQSDAETIVLNGTISDMERYRYMMGRLEGLKMSEQLIRSLIKETEKNF
jgi:hypothetical protein